MSRNLEVALIDVGGTLWPNAWPLRATDGEHRRARLAGVLSHLAPDQIDAFADDLIEMSRFGDEARTATTEVALPEDAATIVTRCLTNHGLECDAVTVARVRRAMALPIGDRRPLPGAAELLAGSHALGLRNVITSNTYWRDAESYWEDFRLLGMAELIDGVVTSNDAGHLKPHPAVFEMAMRTSGVPADRCVVIGNREENDIAPALQLGMWAILVYPDDPKPVATRAHAVAPDLWACAQALRELAA